MHVALITFAKIHMALKKTFCIKKKKTTYGAFLVIPVSCLGSEQFPTVRKTYLENCNQLRTLKALDQAAPT